MSFPTRTELHSFAFTRSRWKSNRKLLYTACSTNNLAIDEYEREKWNWNEKPFFTVTLSHCHTLRRRSFLECVSFILHTRQRSCVCSVSSVWLYDRLYQALGFRGWSLNIRFMCDGNRWWIRRDMSLFASLKERRVFDVVLMNSQLSLWYTQWCAVAGFWTTVLWLHALWNKETNKARWSRWFRVHFHVFCQQTNSHAKSYLLLTDWLTDWALFLQNRKNFIAKNVVS